MVLSVKRGNMVEVRRQRERGDVASQCAARVHVKSKVNPRVESRRSKR